MNPGLTIFMKKWNNMAGYSQIPENVNNYHISRVYKGINNWDNIMCYMMLQFSPKFFALN
jgi:hypothetical protein